MTTAYTPIPPALLMTLSKIEIKCLLVLLERTDTGTTSAPVSLKTLASASGLGVKSVTRAIQGLEERHLLTTQRGSTPEQGYSTNIYTLDRVVLGLVQADNPTVKIAQEVKPSPRPQRNGPSRKRIAAAVSTYPGYPEARIFAGERVGPRDIAIRLNALEKEIAADPNPQGDTVRQKRVIEQYLEAELQIEMKLRDQERAKETLAAKADRQRNQEASNHETPA